MHAATIERHDGHHPALTARWGVHDLIRTRDGREFPTPGPWTVRRGQRVTLLQRGLRRRTINATVLDGTFAVADDPAGSSLELLLTIDDTADLLTVTAVSALAVDVTYRGVFSQRGRPPSMWLTVAATLNRSVAPQLRGRRDITLHAELNLSPAAARPSMR